MQAGGSNEKLLPTAPSAGGASGNNSPYPPDIDLDKQQIMHQQQQMHQPPGPGGPQGPPGPPGPGGHPGAPSIAEVRLSARQPMTSTLRAPPPDDTMQQARTNKSDLVLFNCGRLIQIAKTAKILQ